MKTPRSAVWCITLSIMAVVVSGCAQQEVRERASAQSQTTTTVSSGYANSSASTPKSTPTVSWMFMGSEWRANGTPESCPDPLRLQPPVDLDLVTEVLYPGQIRGGNYKPHGGFRFGKSLNDDITVRVPLDAQLVKASRYIETGETQYLLMFISPCGIAYRFDHLRTLSEKVMKIMDTLPEARVDDSRTTTIEPPVSFVAGEVVATSVGFIKNANVFVDFGVYDLRKKNEISQDGTWASQHQKFIELEHYAVCWFDLFPATDASRLKRLPGADAAQGKKSDYCS